MQLDQGLLAGLAMIVFASTTNLQDENIQEF